MDADPHQKVAKAEQYQQAPSPPAKTESKPPAPHTHKNVFRSMSQGQLIEELQLTMDLLWFFESKLMQGLVDSYLLAV